MDTGKSEISENIGLRTRSKSNTDETVDKNEDRQDKEKKKKKIKLKMSFIPAKFAGRVSRIMTNIRSTRCHVRSHQ